MRLNTKTKVGSAVFSAFIAVSAALFLNQNTFNQNGNHANQQQSSNSLKKPEKIKSKHDVWTLEESQAYQNALSAKLQSPPPSLAKVASVSGNFAGGSLSGTWTPKGAYNQPGCWEMAAFDERDNTVWGMTCAHYGGPQFIFKGSLAEDDFELISGKFPNQFVDMVHRPISGGQRLIVGIRNGKVAYTDDDGKNWITSSGISGNVQSVIVNPQDNNSVYATDGRFIYRSSNGVSFSVLKDLGSSMAARLYSPQFDTQPEASTVYFTHGSDFYQINSAKTDFTKLATGPWPNYEYKRFAIGGDANRLYVSNHERWFVSTNQGTSWSELTGTYASKWPGHHIATHPLSSDTLVLGYLNPTFSHDGMASNFAANIWGGHQVWQPAGTSTQEEKHRVRIHADHQATQFFIDKDGKIFTLHSTDGGLMVSYKDWSLQLADWTGEADGHYPIDTYRNINLLGCQTTEIYEQAMVTGAYNINDIVTGTQDQGTQTYEGKQSGTQLYFKQSPYGDGPRFVSGDGITGWGVSGSSVYKPFDLYNGSTFKGVANRTSNLATASAYGNFIRFYPDFANPGTILWGRTNSKIIKHTYNGSSISTNAYSANSSTINAFAQSPSNPSTLYLLQGGALFKSTNSGVSWNSGVSTGMTTSSNKCEMNVSPTDVNTVLMACAGKAALTTNGGTSVTSVSAGMAQTNVHGMVTPTSGEYSFITTEMGPYVFKYSNQTWYDLTDGTDIPWFNAYNIELVQDSIVRFGTWGLGIYDFTIKPPGGFLSLESSFAGAQYHAGDSLDVLWTSNETGSVKVSLWQNSTLVRNYPVVNISQGNIKIMVGPEIGENFKVKIENTTTTKSATSGTFSITPQLYLIEQPSHYTLVSTDSEQGDGLASNVFDGDINTIWHTQYSPSTDPMPHEIVFRLDTLAPLAALQYTPRQSGINGYIKDYEIYVGTDGVNWTKVAGSTLGAFQGPSTLYFDQVVTGDYVKLVATSEINNQAFTSASEIRVFAQDDNIPDHTVILTRGTLTPPTWSSISKTGFELSLEAGLHATLNVVDLQGRHQQHKRLAGSSSSQYVEFKKPLPAGNWVVILETSNGQKLTKSVRIRD